MREIVSGIEGEAELSSLTVKTTGHKCPNGDISEALVKQFGEGEVSVVIICYTSFIRPPPPAPGWSRSSQVALRTGK